MQDFFDNVRTQLHEIRNLVGPVDLKLANLEHQFAETRTLFEEKTASIESRLLVHAMRLGDHTTQIASLSEQNLHLSERVQRIELALRISPLPAGDKAPVREDKTNPEILPPQAPPV